MIWAETAKKCAPIPPVHGGGIHQAQIGFVDQSGCLQGMALPLAAHVIPGHPP